MNQERFENLDDLTDRDIKQAVGQMLLVGFEGAQTAPPDHLATSLKEGAVGGVILFDRNIESIEQVSELNRAIHRDSIDAIEPPFVSIDQEGGRVTRLDEPLTPIPPMEVIGEKQNLELIADVSEIIASEIEALGFNLNFAPVLDINTNPLNDVIGDRAFGRDPEFVSIAGGTFLFGHYKSGVIPCGKHFPGHGDTVDDSHKTLPVLKHDKSRLDRVELTPFKRVIDNEIPMLMTAHLLIPSLDPEHPATLSSEIIGSLLRDELGYNGVVITDDLEMDAIQQHYSLDETLELGLEAGIDCFMFAHSPSKWQEAHEKLFAFATESDENLTRVLKSADRIRRLKQNHLGHRTRPWSPRQNWREILGSQKNRAILDDVEFDEGNYYDPTL